MVANRTSPYYLPPPGVVSTNQDLSPGPSRYRSDVLDEHGNLLNPVKVVSIKSPWPSMLRLIMMIRGLSILLSNYENTYFQRILPEKMRMAILDPGRTDDVINVSGHRIEPWKRKALL